jgi:lysophospholipase L1-like esterase
MKPAAGFVAYAMALLIGAGAVATLGLESARAQQKASPTGSGKAASGSSPGKTTTSKKSTTARASAKRTAAAVTAKQRAQAAEAVTIRLKDTAPIENPAALVPFLLQLDRLQSGESKGLLHILQFGDSHTAADDWTGMIRRLLQSRFGDGGTGFMLAGRPFLGYRRLETTTTATRGWTSDGLATASGDGLFGLGGTSVSTRRAGQSVSLEADCSRFELFFWRQPGGGRVALSVDGAPQDTIETDGDPSPAYFDLSVPAGRHLFALSTLEAAPVRLFGWVAEKESGVTYESLGINGAQASLILNWNEGLYDEHLRQRDPALIVLAYGTNEAGVRDWTAESYGAMFSELIQRLRRASPTASILVIGPPDRYVRSQGRWRVMDKVDMIIEAQRQAAIENGCAFWDLRQQMGGKGSMRQWVVAGLAQGDHVHFTSDGYRLLGGAVYEELLRDFEFFQRSGAGSVSKAIHEQTNENP